MTNHAGIVAGLLLALVVGAACGPRPDPLLLSNAQQTATSTPATPAPSPTAPATAAHVPPRCRSSRLQLGIGDPISEPTDQDSLSLLLTNRSNASCSLFGYPTVQLLDAGGQALPFAYCGGCADQVVGGTPTLVVLPPRASAYVTINTEPCGGPSGGALSVVQLTPPGAGTALQVKRAPTDHGLPLEYCGPSFLPSLVAISPVEPTQWDTRCCVGPRPSRPVSN